MLGYYGNLEEALINMPHGEARLQIAHDSQSTVISNLGNRTLCIRLLNDNLVVSRYIDFASGILIQMRIYIYN